MYAPDFDCYVEWLRNNCRNHNTTPAYDERSLIIIDEILEMLQKITPITSNGCRELWFCLERGPIEAFGNYEDMLEEGMVANYEEFVENWQMYYPDEYKWYNFNGIIAKNNWKAISINHRIIIEINPILERGCPYEIQPFAEALKECVTKCISQIKEGSYMDYISPRVPASLKFGTILQGDIWDLYPENKAEFFKGLSEADISEFLNRMKNQDHSSYKPAGRLPQMTANDFYRFCAIGYRAMDYDGCDLPLRAQYELHADGRDEDLDTINPDSPEEFKEWLTNRVNHGGHPWEVCRGGNSTHISLYVGIDDDGYYLSLEGSSYGRSSETIKFYLALCRNNVPVQLHDGDHLTDRVLGKEKIGVVPQGIIPRYCHSYFPGEDIIEFTNLPFEESEAFAAKCVWKELNKAELLEGADANG